MKPAVVLMAYGSPSDLADIRPYLEDIRSGRPVSDEAVEELTERYRRIGGRSPLDDVTEGTRAGARARARLPGLRGHEALDAEDRRGRRPGRSRAAPTRSSGSSSRRTTRSSRSTATASGSRTRSTAAPGCGSSRAGTCTSRTWTCSPTACAAPTRTSSSRRTACRRGSSTWATRIATSCSRRRSSIAERAGPRVVVVRVPERERDRRAVARAGHPRGARRPARAGRRARARLPDRVRQRPPRDPVGHRRRGAGARGRARASSSTGSSR